MSLGGAAAHHGIADVALFASLGEGCLAELQRISVRRSFVDGQVIHMQDDEARFLDVVCAGHVRLSYVMEDGSAVVHDVVPRRATFGELSVLDRSTCPDIATAVGRVSVLSFPSAALSDLARTHPALEQALRDAVATRFRAYIALVCDLSLQSLPARLARTLLRVSDRLGTTAEHGGRRVCAIGGIVTQTDLGLMARGSRGNVNRALQGWQRAGWITLKDRSILILDRDALSRLAERNGD